MHRNFFYKDQLTDLKILFQTTDNMNKAYMIDEHTTYHVLFNISRRVV